MGPGSAAQFPAPVLMYHDLVDDPSAVSASHRPYVLPEERFVAQLCALTRAGFRGVSVETLLDTPSVRPESRRPCVLTFDDGHASNATRALPALAAASFRATFFITVGWVGQPPYMTWDQIRVLADAGMEVGSHSMTHRPPSTLTPAELDTELRESKRRLEDRIGRAVRSASSPTGFFNPKMADAARAAGYDSLCVGRIGLWEGLPERFDIPRIPIKLSTSEREFQQLAGGERLPVALLRCRQAVRDRLKRTLGVDRYLRVRAMVLGRRRPS